MKSKWVTNIPKDRSGWISRRTSNIPKFIEDSGKWIVEFTGEVETKNPEGEKALAKIKKELTIKQLENKTETLVRFKGIIEIKKPKTSSDVSVIINKLKKKIPDEAKLVSFEIISSKGKVFNSSCEERTSSKCKGLSEKQIKAFKKCIKENF